MQYTDRNWQELVLSSNKYSDIGGLPSDFIAYPELTRKKLYIRPFTIAELKLISKSIVTKDVKHVIRAVDLVIDMPADRLTIGDFYYILMWLRLNSYPKSPLAVQWECNELVYRTRDSTKFLKFSETPSKEELADWVKTPCKTSNNEAIHNANTKVYELPDNTKLPEGYDFPRVCDLQNISLAKNDPELSFLVNGLQWIKGDWDYKLAQLNGVDGVDFYDTGSALNETIIHGVGEKAVLTCKGCGAKADYQVQLNAASFFR
jgi:hypothetical protein